MRKCSFFKGWVVKRKEESRNYGASSEKGFELYPGFPASLEPRKVKTQFARLTIQIHLSLLSEVN